MFENKYPERPNLNVASIEEPNYDWPRTKQRIHLMSKRGWPIIQWEKSGMALEPECQYERL